LSWLAPKATWQLAAELGKLHNGSKVRRRTFNFKNRIFLSFLQSRVIHHHRSRFASLVWLSIPWCVPGVPVLVECLFDQITLPQQADRFSSQARVLTASILRVPWQHVVFFPEGVRNTKTSPCYRSPPANAHVLALSAYSHGAIPRRESSPPSSSSCCTWCKREMWRQ